MYKTKYFIALVAIFSLVFLGGQAFAQGHYNEWVPGRVQGYYHPTGWNGVDASWLIGQKVHSPLNGDLGQISNLLIDRENGRISMVILSDVPGFGSEDLAVPFAALERTGEDVFQLNIHRENIPAPMREQYNSMGDRYAYELQRHKDLVGLSSIPSAIDSRWIAAVYRFYGIAPSADIGAAGSKIEIYRAAETTNPLVVSTTPVLMGSRVRSRDGRIEMRIDDLVIDSRDGRVALIAVEGAPGRGENLVAVPFGELFIGGNGLVFNATEQRLASAPLFQAYADVNSPNFAANVYGIFGLRPYWTE